MRSVPRLLVLLLVTLAAVSGEGQQLKQILHPVAQKGRSSMAMTIPQPQTALSENLKATRLRTGAVLLQWWTASPGKVESVIWRRDLSGAGVKVELARVRADRFVDRTVLPGRNYEYEVETIGDSSDGGGQQARARVTVGDVVAPLPPKLFQVVRDPGGVLAQWQLVEDSRATEILLEYPEPSGARKVVSRPASEQAYLWKTGATMPSAGSYRLGVVESKTLGGGISESAAELIEAFPDISKIELEPHPRLFIKAADIKRYKQWAQDNASIKKALDDLEAEADEAYRSMLERRLSIPRARDTRTHENNVRMMRQIALGWAFTGRDDLRKCAEELLLDYASFYADIPIVRSYADGYLTGQTLNEARLIITLAWTYDLLYDSLDESKRQRIEEGIFIPAYKLLERSDRGASNWQSYHNAAMISIGLVMGQRDYLQHAIHGPVGLLWQMHNTLGMDGLYYAQSIAYHYFTMSAFTLSAAMLYESGIDLFSYQSGGRSLRNMYEVPFYHAMSDGNQAPFGNSQTTYNLTAQWIASNYAYAYRHYRDPAYLWQWQVSKGEGRRNDVHLPVLLLLAQIHARELENEQDGVPTIARPMIIGTGSTFSPAIRNVVGSTILEDVGMGVLRGSTQGRSGESAMIWKPHGKTAGHQHPNSLGLYWQSSSGYRWISGSGKWADYGADVHRNWVVHTLSDNTMLVDRKSHAPLYPGSPTWLTDADGKPTNGYLVGFTAGPDFGYISAYNNRVYEYASITRRHVNAGAYALDMMRGASVRDSVFDYVLHFWGELEESNIELSENPAVLADGNGYPYLEKRRSGESDHNWVSRWKASNSRERLYLDVIGARGTVYHVARTPWAENQHRSTVLTTREGREADFIALWRANEGSDPILGIRWIGGDKTPNAVSGGLSVQLQGGGEDIHVWGPTISENKWSDIYFRARDAMLRLQDGKLRGATLVESDRLLLSNRIDLIFSLPVTWSWRALDNGGFLLIYDDDYPVFLKVDSAQSYSATLLDAVGKPEESIQAVGEQQWKILPRTNILFLPQEGSATGLPSLIKTVQ